MSQFKDNARVPIIAFDFDGTLNSRNVYPHTGEPRPFAKQVVNLLHDMGVKVIIWTCRDRTDIMHQLGGHEIYDDITPMKEWLDENGFKYNAINSVIQYAPFHYEARKIYAHMYVDDRAFGWVEHKFIMLDVLESFLVNVIGINDINDIYELKDCIVRGEEINIDKFKDYIHRWRM